MLLLELQVVLVDLVELRWALLLPLFEWKEVGLIPWDQKGRLGWGCVHDMITSWDRLILRLQLMVRLVGTHWGDIFVGIWVIIR